MFRDSRAGGLEREEKGADGLGPGLADLCFITAEKRMSE